GQTPLFPRIFGHEAGGILESVGEGVTHLKPGDYAFPVFTGECGECPHCKLEERNMCDLFRINTDRESRFSIKEKPIYHFDRTSTFSDTLWFMLDVLQRSTLKHHLTKFVFSTVESAHVLVPLSMLQNQNLVFLLLFLGSELLVLLYVSLYFSLRCSFYSYGSRAVERARISGASRIIGVDLVFSQFELAKKFGVNEFVNPKDHNKDVQD
ncbi:hypothetical protein S83_028493, partial [Arachis hypogaea]